MLTSAASSARNRSINIYVNRSGKTSAQLREAYQAISPVQVVVNNFAHVDTLSGEISNTFTFINLTDAGVQGY